MSVLQTLQSSLAFTRSVLFSAVWIVLHTLPASAQLNPEGAVTEDPTRLSPYVSAAVAAVQLEATWNDVESVVRGSSVVDPLRDTSPFQSYARVRSLSEGTVRIAEGTVDSALTTTIRFFNPTSEPLCIKHVRAPAGLVPRSGFPEVVRIAPNGKKSLALARDQVTILARPGAEQRCQAQTTNLLTSNSTSALFEVSYAVYRCDDTEAVAPLRTVTLAVTARVMLQATQIEECNFDQLTISVHTDGRPLLTPLFPYEECPFGMEQREDSSLFGVNGCFCPLGDAPQPEAYARETKSKKHCAPPPAAGEGTAECGEHAKIVRMADGSQQCHCEAGYGVAQNNRTTCQKIPACKPDEYVDDAWGLVCKKKCDANMLWSKDPNGGESCMCGGPAHPFYWTGTECLPRQRCGEGEFYDSSVGACSRKCDLGFYPVRETELAPGVPENWSCCPDGTVVSGDRCVAATKVCQCPAGTTANSSGGCVSSTPCPGATAVASATASPSPTASTLVSKATPSPTASPQTTPTVSPQSTAVACGTPVPQLCTQQVQDHGAAQTKRAPSLSVHHENSRTSATSDQTQSPVVPPVASQQGSSIDPDPQAGMPDAASASQDLTAAQRAVNQVVAASGDTVATSDDVTTLSRKLTIQDLKERRQQLRAILRYQDDPKLSELLTQLEVATDEATLSHLIAEIDARLRELRAGRTDLDAFLKGGFQPFLDEVQQKAKKVLEFNGESPDFLDVLKSIVTGETDTGDVQAAINEFSAALMRAQKELEARRHEITPEAFAQLSLFFNNLLTSLLSTSTTRDEQLTLGGSAVGAYAHLVFRASRLAGLALLFPKALQSRNPELIATTLAMITYELEVIRMMKDAALDSEDFGDYANRYYRDVDPAYSENAGRTATITGAITWMILRGKAASSGDIRLLAAALEAALGITGVQAILDSYLDGLMLIAKGISEGDPEAQREGWKKLADAGIDSANLDAIYEALRKIGRVGGAGIEPPPTEHSPAQPQDETPSQSGDGPNTDSPPHDPADETPPQEVQLPGDGTQPQSASEDESPAAPAPFNGLSKEQILKEIPPPISPPADSVVSGPETVEGKDYLRFKFDVPIEKLQLPEDAKYPPGTTARVTLYYHNYGPGSNKVANWRFNVKIGKDIFVLIWPAGEKGPFQLNNFTMLRRGGDQDDNFKAYEANQATPAQRAELFETWWGMLRLFRNKESLLEKGLITPEDVERFDDTIHRGHFYPGKYVPGS